MIYNKAKKIFTIIFIISLFFVFKNVSIAKDSPDAISIRVIPNPAHYSPQRWYNEQGFVGTPQQLLVDGYDAVRNGNTVYVNAANIAGAVPTLFTNIYIISYNIAADNETEDIFTRILENWKFNTNIGVATGFCSPDFSSMICLTNNDCSLGEYCSSDKAEVIRDTTRLANIAEFNIDLDDYMKKNGHYPTLSAGTYLPNKTVSTWPSWQGELSKELGVQLPVDPINDLGDCVGYDDVTCWNEDSKEFADPIVDTNLDLPINSRAFVYQASPDGATFDVCSEMESGFVSGAGSGACATGTATAPTVASPSTVTPSTPSVGFISTVNYPPQIIASNIPIAFAGHPYTAYIQGLDPNNDTISWSLDTSMTSWSGWSGAPSLVFTALNSQIRIEALTAGDVGTYNFSITLTDPSGDSTTQSFSIQVQNFPPIINSVPLFHTASSTLIFNDGFTFSGDILNYPLTYTLDQALPNNFNSTSTQSGSIYNFLVSGTLVPDPVSNIINDGITPFVRNLTVTDSYGTSNTEQLIINVINHKPVIQAPPPFDNRIRGVAAAIATPPSVSLPVINSLTANYGNPWTINNIQNGTKVNVDVTVDVSNADNCSWCGVSVPCDGSFTTSFPSAGYQTGTRASCILRASNAYGEVTAEGYTSFNCSGTVWNESIARFEGLFDNGNCPVFSNDVRLCQFPGVCDEPTVLDLTIVSFKVTPVSWVVNDGSPVSVTVELETTGSPTNCSWCGTSIPCDGTPATFTDNIGADGMITSCLLVVEDAVNSISLEETGYTEYACSGPNQSTQTFQGLTGDGGCVIPNGDNAKTCFDDGTRCEPNIYYADEETVAGGAGITNSITSACDPLYTPVSCNWIAPEIPGLSFNNIEAWGGPSTYTTNSVGSCKLDVANNGYYLELYNYPGLTRGVKSTCVLSSDVVYGPMQSVSGTATGPISLCPPTHRPISVEWKNAGDTIWTNLIEIEGNVGAPSINAFSERNGNGYQFRTENHSIGLDYRSICVNSGVYSVAPSISQIGSAGNAVIVTSSESACSPGSKVVECEWRHQVASDPWVSNMELFGGPPSVPPYPSSVLCADQGIDGSGYSLRIENYTTPLEVRSICIDEF